MHHLRLPLKQVLKLGKPRLRQATDLGIVAQNTLHDAGLFTAVLRQQFVLLRLET